MSFLGTKYGLTIEDSLELEKYVEEEVKKRKQRLNMSEFLLILGVTFSFFFLEALIHYNIGKYGKIGISFPVGVELAELVLTMVVFSVLSAATISFLKKLLKMDS